MFIGGKGSTEFHDPCLVKENFLSYSGSRDLRQEKRESSKDSNVNLLVRFRSEILVRKRSFYLTKSYVATTFKFYIAVSVATVESINLSLISFLAKNFSQIIKPIFYSNLS